MNRKRSLTLAAVSFVSLLLCAGVWTELYLHSQNSLLQNGRWVSSKLRMQLHLVGAPDFIESRQALAGNRLNLGAWSGFNELLLNRAEPLHSLRLRLRLAEKAHVSVLFGRSPSGYSGLRLSRHPAFPSLLFRASPEGEFLEREPLEDFDPGPGWHRVELAFADAQVELRVDERELPSSAASLRGPQTLGFRSGLRPVAIDDVQIELASGERVAESFRHERGRFRVLVGFAASFALLAFAIAGLASFGGRRGSRATLASFAFVAANAVACLLGLALLGVDHLYWSSAYFYKTPGIRLADARALPIAVEEFRRELFEDRLPSLLGDPRATRLLPESFVEDSIVGRGRPPRGPSEEYSLFSARSGDQAQFIPFDLVSQLPRKRPGALRIAFLGSSQTWGAGAESPQDSFVARTHRGVAAALPGRGIETINLSINGASSQTQRPLYEQISAYVEPDLLVVNLANNDADPELLAENLRAVLATNAARGAAAVILLEANSLERAPNPRLAAKHAALRALGAELEVPVLDLHGFVNSPELLDSGFLWWDYVHFSSYGHRRVAEWLAPRLAEALRAQASSPSAGRSP